MGAGRPRLAGHSALIPRIKSWACSPSAAAQPASFNQDDVLLASTFAIQASIALENARLYDDLNRFNQMMERMVEQRVEELNSAYRHAGKTG